MNAAIAEQGPKGGFWRRQEESACRLTINDDRAVAAITSLSARGQGQPMAPHAAPPHWAPAVPPRRSGCGEAASGSLGLGSACCMSGFSRGVSALGWLGLEGEAFSVSADNAECPATRRPAGRWRVAGQRYGGGAVWCTRSLSITRHRRGQSCCTPLVDCAGTLATLAVMSRPAGGLQPSSVGDPVGRTAAAVEGESRENRAAIILYLQ